MFSFFKRKKTPDTPAPEPVVPAAPPAPAPAPAPASAPAPIAAAPIATEASVLHEGANLFPETAERPTTEAEKKTS